MLQSCPVPTQYTEHFDDTLHWWPWRISRYAKKSNWSETWIQKVSLQILCHHVQKSTPPTEKLNSIQHLVCHTMTPWKPCRVQPSLNRCRPPKVESGDNLKTVLKKYKNLWHHGKPFFLSFWTKKPRGSPAPLSHLCSQRQCGNIVSMTTLIVCKHLLLHG